MTTATSSERLPAGLRVEEQTNRAIAPFHTGFQPAESDQGCERYRCRILLTAAKPPIPRNEKSENGQITARFAVYASAQAAKPHIKNQKPLSASRKPFAAFGRGLLRQCNNRKPIDQAYRRALFPLVVQYEPSDEP